MAQISVAQNESASTWNMQTVEPLNGTDEWPMFHHDPQNTGYSTSTAPTTNSIGWSFTTAGSWVYSPSVSDGKIYFGSSDHNVYCLNAFTGEKLWDYTTGDVVRSSPAVSNGRVYVGSDDQKIYCLATSTGDLIWIYDTSAGAGSFVSSPVVVDGKIFIGLDKCYCLNASNGNPLWDYYVDGYFINSSPAVFDGKVYAEFSNGELHCLNASTGETVWMHDSNSAGDCSPAVANGKVYIASNDGTVYCLDAATGDPIWTLSDFLEPATFGLTCPAIAEDRLYIGSVNQGVYCMNASTGDLHWGQKTGNSVHSSPAVADGKVYVCSDKAYCLNATVGEPIWTYTTGVYIGSSPAVAYGNVYVGSDKLYCFGSASPTVHNLDTGLDYLTIQAAIDAPETLNGHTIQVEAGQYYENVVLTKSISLIGENSNNTIIDGGGGTSVINVTNVDNVEISGFTIQNGSYGIYLSGSFYINITGNKITESNNGVYLLNSNLNSFSDNSISNNHNRGFCLWYSNDNSFYENKLENNNLGFYLVASSTNVIANNNVTNDHYGIIIEYSANNLLENNNLTNIEINFGVRGSNLSQFMHNIGVTNTVNGKPVYYWIGEQNQSIPSNAGWVALINCTNIIVQNLNLTNNVQGILIANSTNTRIIDNNIEYNGDGVCIELSSNVTVIVGNNVTNNNRGVLINEAYFTTIFENLLIYNDFSVYMVSTFNTNISKNNITSNNSYGILVGGSNTSVIGNEIMDNSLVGIHVSFAANTTISGNNVTNNTLGIQLWHSTNNTIYHNNLINNPTQASVTDSECTWDNSYPSGGNYWSDYEGADIYSGQNQDQLDGDGIGDSPYIIDVNNQDNYPLAGPFGITEHVFNVTVDDTTIPVAISSNSSISEFDFSEASLQVSFNVTGLTGTTGFCNITLPEDLLWGDFSVYMNGEPLVEGLDYTRTYNGTHNIFHTTYTHSSHLIEITGTHVIPEHSSLIILSLLLIATLLIVTNEKRLFRRH